MGKGEVIRAPTLWDLIKKNNENTVYNGGEAKIQLDGVQEIKERNTAAAKKAQRILVSFTPETSLAPTAVH